MDWKIQLVINRHNNKKCDIEIRIPQRLPVPPIFFLIYISKIFDKVVEFNPKVTSLSFINDLDFSAYKYLIKRLAKALGRMPKVVLEWEKYNMVIYNITWLHII